jgi:probable addiction module antidote protein
MPKRVRDYHDFLKEQLRDPAFAADYLTATVRESPDMLRVAMRNVAEAHKMSRVADRAKLNRESLYKSLSPKGNPGFDAVASIVDVFGIEIAFHPKNGRSLSSGRAGRTPVSGSVSRTRRKRR